MVDIVTNHMAYMGCGTCVNYSLFNPFSSVRIVSSLTGNPLPGLKGPNR
jgi:hypothetical protein